MANLLDIDFSDIQTQRIVAKIARDISGELWGNAPKQAIANYFTILLSIPLWLMPIGRSPAAFSLTTSFMAMAAVGRAGQKLEQLQNDIEEDEKAAGHSRVLREISREQITETEHYAGVAQERLSLSQGLPAHLVEGDLMPPKEGTDNKSQSDFEKFKAFMGDSVKLKDKSSEGNLTEKATPTEREEADTTTSRSLNREASQTQPQQYQFSVRKNGRNQTEERIVDLSGHTHYEGIEIVDVAMLMATDERGVLGFGSTSCGKSVLLANAIATQQAIDETTDFTVFAHKSANSARGQQLNFAGMEDSQDCIVFTATQTGDELDKAAEAFQSRLRSLTSLLEEGSLVTSVVVIDQMNQGLKAANRAYQQAKTKRKRVNAYLKPKERDNGPIDYETLADDYGNFNNSGLIDGGEKGVKVWALGHTNTNEGTGVEHQIKRNAAFVGLGRVGNYQAVWNPLKDKRFIEDDDTQAQLSTQLGEFLSRHQANGSPANVVVAITDLGLEGWRLVVLPQYQAQVSVDLNVVNPERMAPAPAPPADKRAAQIQSLNQMVSGYTSEQLSKTRQLVSWLKTDGEKHLKGDVIDSEVYRAIAFIESQGEMEVCLNILCDQGAGEFVYGQGNSMRWKPKGKLREAMQPPQPQPKSPEELAMTEIVKCLSRIQQGTLMNPKAVLDNSRKLRQEHGVTVAFLVKVLEYLETENIVVFPANDRKVFRYEGGLDDAI